MPTTVEMCKEALNALNIDEYDRAIGSSCYAIKLYIVAKYLNRPLVVCLSASFFLSLSGLTSRSS
jgi:hypothetical protein